MTGQAEVQEGFTAAASVVKGIATPAWRGKAAHRDRVKDGVLLPGTCVGSFPGFHIGKWNADIFR
jgi:hypothetical protein